MTIEERRAPTTEELLAKVYPVGGPGLGEHHLKPKATDLTAVLPIQRKIETTSPLTEQQEVLVTEEANDKSRRG